MCRFVNNRNKHANMGYFINLASRGRVRMAVSIGADLKADELIRNTYRTLMSRGMKGCYVYFVDPATAEYFRNRLAL